MRAMRSGPQNQSCTPGQTLLAHVTQGEEGGTWARTSMWAEESHSRVPSNMPCSTQPGVHKWNICHGQQIAKDFTFIWVQSSMYWVLSASSVDWRCFSLNLSPTTRRCLANTMLRRVCRNKSRHQVTKRRAKNEQVETVSHTQHFQDAVTSSNEL